MIYKFVGNYSDKDKNNFREAQEEDLIKICNFLQTHNSKLNQIYFKVFDTREGKQQADPNHSISRASARFDEMAIYRVWTPDDDPHFPHEITHLVAHTWSKPYLLTENLDTAYGTKIKKTFEMVSTCFTQEGLAIAVDDIIFNRKLLEEGEHKYIDEWCREQIDQIPHDLPKVINLAGFDNLPNKVIVPFSASFSKYLLNNFGVEIYKHVYIDLKETNSPQKNVKIIESWYRMTAHNLLKKWKETIDVY